MKNSVLPMNLQLFADSPDDAGGSAPETNVNQNQGIDYGKIQQMLNGTLAAKEDTALKAYFKQQGLSQDEAEQAIATFKAEKAKNQPDVTQLQNQLAQAQEASRKAQIESVAMLIAVGLGIDAKTVPYVLKLADLSTAMGEDGKVSEESINKAIEKVLSDVPALKPQASKTGGFVQVGGSTNGQNASNEDALSKAFGI